MKKMLSMVLALIMSATAIGSVGFAQEEVVKTSDDIYGWQRIDSDYDYDDVNELYDTVTLVDDATYGKVIKSVKQSASHGNSWKGVRQRISASKLISGHTYKLEFQYKMLKTHTWLKVGFNHTVGSTKYFAEPYGNNMTEQWGPRNFTIPYDSAVQTNGLEVVFYNTSGPGTFWVADVLVYDTADPDKTNLIVNGDFTESIEEHNKNFLYGWNVKHSGTSADWTYDYDSTTKEPLDTVSLAHNIDQYGSVLLIKKRSIRHDNSWKGVSATIPAAKLTPGKTYVLEYDLKTSADETWGRAGFSDAYAEPYGPNDKTWKHNRREKAYTSGNITAVFYCVHSAFEMYVANVTIYDKDDVNKTNLLPNGNFSHIDADHSGALYGWTVNNSAQPEDSVKVVEHAEYGTIALIDKKSSRGTNETIFLRNTLDASKLIANHVYVVEYDTLMEPTHDHYAYTGWSGFATGTYSQPWGPQNGTWSTNKTNKITYNGTGTLTAAFGLTGSAGRMWIANVKVYDEADLSKKNLLTNGTFKEKPDLDVEFTYDNGTCVANIYSKKESFNIMLVSAIYDDVTNELIYVTVNPGYVEASDENQPFYDEPDVWGDGYTTRCFLWNADTMKPLAESLTIE